MNICRNVKKIETFFILEYDRQDSNKNAALLTERRMTLCTSSVFLI